jgi:AcrR family transcriptional regulator
LRFKQEYIPTAFRQNNFICQKYLSLHPDMAKSVIHDELIQEEILKAALELYRKLGPHNVTMDDVANATGRSRSSLYYYYKNRDEVFRAVLDNVVGLVTKEIREAVSGANTLPDKIYTFCITKIKTSIDWMGIFKLMWETMDDDEKPKINRTMNGFHKKIVFHEGIILNEIVSEASGKKQIRKIAHSEQDMLAFLVSCSIRGLRNEIYSLNDPHDMEAAARLLANMVTRWLKE